MLIALDLVGWPFVYGQKLYSTCANRNIFFVTAPPVIWGASKIYYSIESVKKADAAEPVAASVAAPNTALEQMGFSVVCIQKLI